MADNQKNINQPVYDGAKNKTEAFLDMKKLVIQIIKEDPELAQNAIRDRNILVKSLKAEIAHKDITYDEIESRYYKTCSDLIICKALTDSLYAESAKKDRDIMDLTSQIQVLNDELNKVKFELSSKITDNTILESKIKNLDKDLKEKNESLERSKIHLAVERKSNARTLSYKLERLSRHIPGWPGKIVVSILSSPWILYALLFMIFILFFTASIIGWAPILDKFAPFYTLFLKG